MTANIQTRRWVNLTELMVLFDVKSRASVYKWLEDGFPFHKLLAASGGWGLLAFDTVEVMNWCQRNGKALPLSMVLHVRHVVANEGEGKGLRYDEALTEIIRGSPLRAPQSLITPFSERPRSKARARSRDVS